VNLPPLPEGAVLESPQGGLPPLPEGAVLEHDDTSPDTFKQRGQLQKDGTYLVSTPTGQMHLDADGKPIGEGKGLNQDIEESHRHSDALSKTVAFTQGFTQHFVPQAAGLKNAVQHLGDGSFGDNYAKGRDEAKKTVKQAVKDHEGYELAGNLIPSIALGGVGGIGTRIAVSGALGAVNGAGEDGAMGALKGAGFGLAGGALGEAVGAGLGKVGSKLLGHSEEAAASKLAAMAREAEKEVLSARGKLGGVSGGVLNALRDGIPGALESQNVSQATKDVLSGFKNSELGARLEQRAAQNMAEALPRKLAEVEAAEEALKLATAEAGKVPGAAKDYFKQSMWAKVIKPKLAGQAPRLGMAAAAFVAGEIAGGGEHGHSVGGLSAVGAILGGPGALMMMKNIGKSPLVNHAIATKLVPLVAMASKASILGIPIATREIAQATMHEDALGEPQLAAEQLVARGGLDSVLKDRPHDVPTQLGLNAAQTPLDHAIKQTIGITTLAGAIDDHHTKTERAIKGLFSGEQSAPDMTHHEPPKDLHNLSSDVLLDRLDKNMGDFSDIAPVLHGQIAATAQRATQYLQSVAATPPPRGPLAPPWQQSQAEKNSLSRAAQVVQDPLSVLDHAKAGTLTSEHMKALTTVYPMLGRSLSDQVLAQLGDKKPESYRHALMLSILSGVDLDGTLGSIAGNQAVINGPSTQPSTQGMGKQGSSKGAAKLTVGSRMAMPNAHDKQKE
jgi:hypothetical protein